MPSNFDKRSAELDAAIDELRRAVDEEMRARHDRPGQVNRDAMVARVLFANPSLAERIESACRADPIHKVASPGSPHPMRRGLEDQVEVEAQALLASGRAETIEKARVAAWQSDRARLDAYHFPGATEVGAAAITGTQARLAADKALDTIAKVLGGDDYIVGHRLACASFPRLASAARGVPHLIP